MFIVCNYFDITANPGINDVIIEDCGEYYTELVGYRLVCKEYRKQDVIDWVRNNTGSRSDRFVKQWDIDAGKALTMLKLQFNVPSYTKEIVENLGGITKYLEVMKLDAPINSENTVNPVESFESYNGVEEASNSSSGETIVGSNSVQESEEVESVMTPYVVNIANDEPVEVVPEDTSVVVTESIYETTGADANADSEADFEDEEEKVEEEPISLDGSEDLSEFADTLEMLGETVPQNENTLWDTAEPLESVAVQGSVQPSLNVQSSHRECVCDCIYNSDGSFKGFTEGQILNLLIHLRELDSRVALEGLNPDYIMTEEELQASVEHLEEFSPSIFKAFFLRSVQSAKSETERIRCSQLIDQLLDFLQSLNKE